MRLDTTSDSGGNTVGRGEVRHLSGSGDPHQFLFEFSSARVCHFPTMVPRSQAYYWSNVWQRDETASLRELEAGEVVRFTTPRDAIRWLLDVDDE